MGRKIKTDLGFRHTEGAKKQDAKLQEFEVTFNLSYRSYFVMAKNQEEAEEKAKQELFSDIQNNMNDIIYETSVEHRKKGI